MSLVGFSLAAGSTSLDDAAHATLLADRLLLADPLLRRMAFAVGLATDDQDALRVIVLADRKAGIVGLDGDQSLRSPDLLRIGTGDSRGPSFFSEPIRLHYGGIPDGNAGGASSGGCINRFGRNPRRIGRDSGSVVFDQRRLRRRLKLDRLHDRSFFDGIDGMRQLHGRDQVNRWYVFGGTQIVGRRAV